MRSSTVRTARRTRFVAIAAVAVLALAACGSDSDDSDDSSGGGNDGATKTVTIGVMAPLDAGLTQFGRGIRDSVQLAVDQANEAGLLEGWNIEVKAVDDSSEPTVGEQNVTELTEDDTVAAVVGTYNSGVAQVVAPKLGEAGIAMISPGNTNPALTLGDDPVDPARPFDNYFRMVATDAQQGGFLAQYAAEDLGVTKVAVITDAKDVSLGLANDFREAFTAAGGTITSFQEVPEEEPEYAPYAERATEGRPELLFFGGEYEHAILVKKAAIAAGLDVPLMGGDGVQAADYITGLGAEDADGDIASSVGSPIPQQPYGVEFLAAYNAADFGDEPSNFGPYAYDATAIILHALEGALEGKDSVDADVRAAVIDAIAAADTAAIAAVEATLNGSGFADAPVTGEIGFDEFGDTVNRILTVYRVGDGEWKPVVTRSFESVE